MANLSDYAENKLIDLIFRSGTFTTPAVLAVALCTAAPTDASTGATITEVPNSGAYARQTLNPSTTNWQDTAGTNLAASAGTTGTTKNSVTITFPTATGNWGTVTHLAIVDSATWGAGNVLFWMALSASQAINTGGTFSLPSTTGISVQIDN